MSVADLRNYTADDALQKILEALERGRHQPDTGQMLCALLLHRDLERIAAALEGVPRFPRLEGDTMAGVDDLISRMVEDAQATPEADRE